MPAVFVRFHRGLQAYRTVMVEPRDKNIKPRIVILWGASGTGKTRTATEEFPDAYLLTKPNADGNVWFDGYDGEDVVIIDEFYGWIKYDLLLRICDRYPLQVPVKGAMVQFKATTIVFTSNVK